MLIVILSHQKSSSTQYLRTKEDVLLVGDFNLGDIDNGNYTAHNSNLSSQLFIKILRYNMFTQLMDTPPRTRIHGRYSSYSRSSLR